MKNIMLICCFLLLIACKKEQSKEIEISEIKQTKNASKGTVELSMDGKIYVYDDIDWKKSRIKNEEDIRLSIRQEGLPQLKLRFPDIEKSLEDGQDTFQIPDVHRRGFSPITLNFIVTIEDNKSEAITFRKGQVKASFKNSHFIMEFNGEGGPTLNAEIIYPIKGTINIKF